MTHLNSTLIIYISLYTSLFRLMVILTDILPNAGPFDHCTPFPWPWFQQVSFCSLQLSLLKNLL